MIVRIKTGEPQVAQGAYVADSARVIGQVTLAEHASVWFGAVLRGDVEPISVGVRSNIQDGCILHTDVGMPLVIGQDVVVGHGALLHGCTILDGALIGIGAKVLNGALVGKGAIVGAGALVPEGREIPPGMMALGIPAKVVRQVTPREQARISAGVAHYLEMIALYR